MKVVVDNKDEATTTLWTCYLFFPWFGRVIDTERTRLLTGVWSRFGHAKLLRNMPVRCCLDVVSSPGLQYILGENFDLLPLVRDDHDLGLLGTK